MKDYQKQLDKFLDFPENKDVVVEYLEKYWLDKQELNEYWIKIKNEVFNPDFSIIPDPVFNKDFDWIVRLGGTALAPEEYELFHSCMKITGDKYFIVLEDHDEDNPPHNSGPPLRFKYPIDITWEEITGGADISEQIYVWPMRMYFIFGDSGKWGKYAGSDYPSPIDIIGFQREYADLFQGKFKISEKELEDLKQWTLSRDVIIPGFNM